MIDIFGSKNLLKIVNNIYGEENVSNKIISSTLESQFSSAIAPSSAQLEIVDENEKEIIISDFRKSFRKLESKSDVLLVDFLSERNSICNYKNSKITFNSEAKKIFKNEQLVTMPMDTRVKLLSTILENFSSSVKDYDKVIICEFYLTNYHIDENNMIKLNSNQYSINRVNALLKTFYDYLKFHNSSFTYLHFETIYSPINKNKKASPWIYSDFSNKTIEKFISQSIEI